MIDGALIDRPLIDTVVIPCFNPQRETIDLVAQLADHINSVIVIDDASDMISPSYYRRLSSLDNVVVVRKTVNRGVAHSLNIGFTMAMTAGSKYVLTLDQDADVPSDFLAGLGRAISELERDDIEFGAVGPGVVNGFAYAYTNRNGVMEMQEIMQSGAVFRTEALRIAGLADESLVIDSVDTDLCLNLRKHGFEVFADGRVHLSHRIGRGQSISLLGKEISVTNHSSRRRYYLTRNRLVMFGRYGASERTWLLSGIFWLAVSTLLAVTVEEGRTQAFHEVRRGMVDAVRGTLGRRGGSLPGTVSHRRSEGVAVVVVAGGGRDRVARQLQSVMNQTLPPAAVIIVDERSGDGAKQFAADYLRRFPQVECLSIDAPEDAAGATASGLAAGLQAAARFRFIAIAEVGEIWEPGRLARQRARLQQSGAVLTAAPGIAVAVNGDPVGDEVRNLFPTLKHWNLAGPVERLHAVLREPAPARAAVMMTNRMVPSALPIPAGWEAHRWLELVAVVQDSLDSDDQSVMRYRIARDAGPSKRRLREKVSAPVNSALKLRDVSRRLRSIATHDAIEKELAAHRIARTFLQAGGRSDELDF